MTISDAENAFALNDIDFNDLRDYIQHVDIPLIKNVNLYKILILKKWI